MAFVIGNLYLYNLDFNICAFVELDIFLLFNRKCVCNCAIKLFENIL